MKSLHEKNNISTELSIAGPLYPVDATDMFALRYWASDYNRRNKYPVDKLKRFVIAFYQIHQGMGWKDGGVNKFESLAASILHLLMIEDITIETGDSFKIKDFEHVSLNSSCYLLLYNLSAAQQQLFYGDLAYKLKRKSRFDQNKLIGHLSICIRTLLQAIPQELRSECFYEASRIMTKELK